MRRNTNLKTYKNKLIYWCFYKNPTYIKFDNRYR